MKTQEIFDLALRLVGLWFLASGLAGAPGALGEALVGFPFGTIPHLIGGAWPLAVGVWFLRGAPGLERFVPVPKAPANPGA